MSDPISDLKQELLAAAERRQAHATPETDRVRLRSHPRRNRVLLAAATLPIAAAVALLVTAPWSNSPGFLEKAQAALTPPPGSILHFRYEETQVSKDFGCTATMGPKEVWIDQRGPHRYRALLEEFEPPPEGADPRTRACRRAGGVVEIGGARDGSPTLRFVPPDTLSLASGLFLTFDPDPVTTLREAIRNGRAHDEGKTQLDGRTVERIRIECPDPPCASPPDYAYVDPETFEFVQEEWPSGLTFVPGPDGRAFRFDVVLRYLTFEYLPRTAANVALTDIRAQHPGATGP